MHNVCRMWVLGLRADISHKGVESFAQSKVDIVAQVNTLSQNLQRLQSKAQRFRINIGSQIIFKIIVIFWFLAPLEWQICVCVFNQYEAPFKRMDMEKTMLFVSAFIHFKYRLAQKGDQAPGQVSRSRKWITSWWIVCFCLLFTSARSGGASAEQSFQKYTMEPQDIREGHSIASKHGSSGCKIYINMFSKCFRLWPCFSHVLKINASVPLCVVGKVCLIK